MNLEKAIETLTKEYERWKVCNQWDYCIALKLGIEALKRLEEDRRDNPHTAWLLLPGETKD